MAFAMLNSCGSKPIDDDNVERRGDTVTLYIDSNSGNDTNKGTSESTPWKSLTKLESFELNPGDTVRFKRGSSFKNRLDITCSGTSDRKITLSDYGNKSLPPPSFTNQNFKQDDFGNCIKIKGSYIVIENLLFKHTPTYVEGEYITEGGWKEWEMGALYIDKEAKNCHVRNNEFFDCVAGIRSYGIHVLIENNYIHDCSRPLRKWNWGPIGIWLGNDFQEVRNNRIINIRGEDPNYVSDGADGGAIEIDDERFDKKYISLHHNFTQDCQGFLEIVLNDVIENKAPIYEGFSIHHNVCNDYSAFCKIREAKKCTIDNNTVVRFKRNSNEKGILVFKGNDTKNLVRNNIFVVAPNVPFTIIYNKPAPAFLNNLYYSPESTTSGIGVLEDGAIFDDPCFVNLYTGKSPEDFSLRHESPAIDRGLDLGYKTDFSGNSIPCGKSADIGAFEIQ
jgi:hypothetical protein